jgi:hypothetical protein
MKSVSMLCVMVVALSACSSGKAPEAVNAATPALESYATTRQVMLGLTIPASNLLFQLGDNTPKDDAGWEVVVATAMTLAESGNLMLTGTRDLHQPEWTDFSRRLIESAKKAAAAAHAKDVDQVLDAGNELYEVCDACHQKYLPARAAETPAPKT